MQTILFGIVTGWLAALGWYDCRLRRLPNVLTLGGAAVFIVIKLLMEGWPGVLNGLCGGLCGFLFLLIPFAIGGAGAGDVKMLTAIGVLGGFPLILHILTLSSIVGIFQVIWMVLARRLDMARLRHFAKCCFCFHYDREAGRQALPPRESEKVRVPFGLSIALSTWICILLTII